MLFILRSSQTKIDHPSFIKGPIAEQFLPVVGVAEPDKAQKVGDNQGLKDLLHNFNDVNRQAVVGNFVISVLNHIQIGHQSEQSVFWEEISTTP